MITYMHIDACKNRKKRSRGHEIMHNRRSNYGCQEVKLMGIIIHMWCLVISWRMCLHDMIRQNLGRIGMPKQ